MQTTITARHFVLTPEMRDYVTEKVRKLERYSSYIMSAEIILARDSGSDLMEAKLHLRHDLLTAKAEAKDFYQATTQLVDRLMTQLKRHDDRLKNYRPPKALRRTP